jgi:ribosomal protein S30
MGKVHGSLARAGKVKSQTPKVSGHHLHTALRVPKRIRNCWNTNDGVDFSIVRSNLKRRRRLPRAERRSVSHIQDVS